MIPSRFRVVGLAAASVIPLLCGNQAQALPSVVPPEAPGIVFIHDPNELPDWANPFGHEFWLQATRSSSDAILGSASAQALPAFRS